MRCIIILFAAMLAVCAAVFQPTKTPTVEVNTPAITAQQEQNEALPIAEKTAPDEAEPLPVQQESDTAPAVDTDASAETAEPIAEVVPAEEDVEPPMEVVPAVVEATLVIEEPIIVESAKTDIPAVVEHAKTGGPDDAPVIIEHAKTGYEGEDTTPGEPPVVEPEQPTEPASINEAIAVAEAFAIETYNVTIDPSLDFNNSAYRFPAAVPLDASQEFLNSKAIGVVDYTFQQQIHQFGVTIEKLRETGIHCRIYVEQTEHDYLIYCMYA